MIFELRTKHLMEQNNDFSDEQRLVSGLKKGQEEAFRVLIRRYQDKLFSIAYGITLDREESLDIVQEVFLKVYQKIHQERLHRRKDSPARQRYCHRSGRDVFRKGVCRSIGS